MKTNYYTPIGGLGVAHLGQAADQVARVQVDSSYRPSPVYRYVWGALSLAGAGSGAYHGYKRNRGSIGWAIGWFLLGGLFPVVTIPVSLAQGFGKPAVKSNRRRRRRRTSRRTSRRR